MELFMLSFAALFSIMNPLGTVPLFVGLTQENTVKERTQIAFWTSVNVLIILLLSFFAGKYILLFFGISLSSLKLAGGLIIASSGFALLTGKFREHKGMKRDRVQNDIKTRSEISLTPLAIPMLAGPGAISLLITYNQTHQEVNQILLIVGAVIFTTLCIYLLLNVSRYIVKALGASGINALSRVIGFIVIAIGIEMITTTALSLFESI
jgi:multiple antibiotic resistance protein